MRDSSIHKLKAISSDNGNMTILIFTLMNFALMMTASVFNGILDILAKELSVSVADAGLLNTWYSYGAAFGVPIILIIFRKIERSTLLKITLFITIITSILIIYTKVFRALLIVRFVMGIAANTYGILALATVVSLAKDGKVGSSIALLVTGSSIGLIIGVPLTRILTASYGWTSMFLIIVFIMIISLIYFLIFLPKEDNIAMKLSMRKQFVFLRDKKVSLLIFSAFLMFFAYGTFNIYISAYVLDMYPSVEAYMSYLLVIFGISSLIGNSYGGKMADKLGYSKSILLGAIVQLIILILIYITKSNQWVNIALLCLYIVSAWFTGLQFGTGVAIVTNNKSNFILSINSSAIQLSTAIGSSIASGLINQMGMSILPIFATVATSFFVMAQFIKVKTNDK